jgi:hypothetical protein
MTIIRKCSDCGKQIEVYDYETTELCFECEFYAEDVDAGIDRVQDNQLNWR